MARCQTGDKPLFKAAMTKFSFAFMWWYSSIFGIHNAVELEDSNSGTILWKPVAPQIVLITIFGDNSDVKVSIMTTQLVHVCKVHTCQIRHLKHHLPHDKGESLSFPGMGIPMLKIRRSWDRLIFNMGIRILVRQNLYIRQGPDSHIDGLVLDCINAIAKALKLLQSCTEPSIFCLV